MYFQQLFDFKHPGHVSCLYLRRTRNSSKDISQAGECSTCETSYSYTNREYLLMGGEELIGGVDRRQLQPDQAFSVRRVLWQYLPSTIVQVGTCPREQLPSLQFPRRRPPPLGSTPTSPQGSAYCCLQTTSNPINNHSKYQGRFVV